MMPPTPLPVAMLLLRSSHHTGPVVLLVIYAVWLFRSGAGAFVSPRPVAFIILFTQGYTFRVNNRLYRTTNTPYMSVNDDGTSENAAATEADINTVYCIVVSSVFGCRRTESNHHSKVFAPMVSDPTAAA